MEEVFIDINCDVGEGVGNEAALMPLISSCNIACGGHAGDPQTMSEVLGLAKRHGVKVGAHPSYPDRENFGRVSMDISEKTLIASIQEQMIDFMVILRKQKIKLHHIKPHGALYNDIAKNSGLATAFLKAIKDFKEMAFIYVPPESEIEKQAMKVGFEIKIEAFADRNYNPDLSLVSRKLENAVIYDPKKVLAHLFGMVKEGKVITMNGQEIRIQAETFCVHGDTPSALEILNYLTEELPKLNIRIKR